MTTYEPGRIYSVENEDGQRHLAIYRDSGMFVYASGGGGSSEFADVRGPLVVLDLDPTETEIVRDLLVRSIRPSANKAADQIEEQTRPPLQVGWHEVRESPQPVRWDGTRWTPDPLYIQDNYTSLHYIGPSRRDLR